MHRASIACALSALAAAGRNNVRVCRADVTQVYAALSYFCMRPSALLYETLSNNVRVCSADVMQVYEALSYYCMRP
jgi:hypothetical protein